MATAEVFGEDCSEPIVVLRSYDASGREWMISNMVAWTKDFKHIHVNWIQLNFSIKAAFEI